MSTPRLPDTPRLRDSRGLRAPVSLAIFGILAFFLVVATALGERRLPPGIWIVAVFAVICVFGSWTMRRTRKFNTRNEAALADHRRGDFAAAADRLEALRREYALDAGFARIATHNLARAELRMGSLARALELLEEVESRRWPRERGAVYALSASHLAFAHALAGDVGAARAWLAEADERVDTGGGSPTLTMGLRYAARIAIAIRAGEPDAGVRELRGHWRELVGTVDGEFLRSLRVLRAFASSLASDAVLPADVQDQLALTREAAPDEFVYLAVAWPELRAFLAREGLVNVAR